MATIPFKINDAVVVVNVLVRGSKNGRLIKMVIDTGASITSIPSDIALAIGIDPSKPIKRIEIITASGTEYVPVVIVPRVQFLGFSLKNVEIACLNLPPQSTVSGLLGLNILKKFNLSFKFREGFIKIEDYEGLQETVYLLRSPKNTKRLLKSINQLEI
jgi:clan AA aspartic protease (TIGR02281 family)